ncbi:MAG: transglycosylase family protein [Acidimicrobiales bacterium]|nr:transglycosylase family protein [Acidimicrobiales bacterium]
MTDGIRSSFQHRHATRFGPIISHVPLDTDAPGATFRRRRLGVLTAVLLAVLVAVVVVAPGSDADEVEVASGTAAEAGFTTQSDGSPVTLSAIVAETTSTLLETTTTTTTAPTTTTTVAATTTESAPATTAAPTTAAPTTAAPTTAPPTTAAATTAPPATAAPTTTPPAPTTTGDGGDGYADPNSRQVWLDLAQCESNGNWSINTGNGYYGGLQFSEASWRGVGGTGLPHQHSAATQIEMGRRLQASHGWGAWPHCSSELGLR